jgi:DNA-binding protein Fis
MRYREELRRFQAEYLERLMTEAKGSLSRAARIADVNRSHLRQWLHEHGMLKRRTSAAPRIRRSG